MGAHNGAYNGRVHTVVPHVGRKTLFEGESCRLYVDIHGFYRATILKLFMRLFVWSVECGVWIGSGQERHCIVRVLMHIMKFTISRQKHYQPYGLWEHVPDSMWLVCKCCWCATGQP